MAQIIPKNTLCLYTPNQLSQGLPEKPEQVIITSYNARTNCYYVKTVKENKRKRVKAHLLKVL